MRTMSPVPRYGSIGLLLLLLWKPRSFARSTTCSHVSLVAHHGLGDAGLLVEISAGGGCLDFSRKGSSWFTGTTSHAGRNLSLSIIVWCLFEAYNRVMPGWQLRQPRTKSKPPASSAMRWRSRRLGPVFSSPANWIQTLLTFSRHRPGTFVDARCIKRIDHCRRGFCFRAAIFSARMGGGISGHSSGRDGFSCWNPSTIAVACRACIAIGSAASWDGRCNS